MAKYKGGAKLARALMKGGPGSVKGMQAYLGCDFTFCWRTASSIMFVQRCPITKLAAHDCAPLVLPPSLRLFQKEIKIKMPATTSPKDTLFIHYPARA